jgi:hypothetical protein
VTTYSRPTWCDWPICWRTRRPIGSEIYGEYLQLICYGNVEGWYTFGGLVGGISYDDIHDSFSTGDMTLLESGAWIGGVFGDYLFDWTVDNVYCIKSDHNAELTFIMEEIVLATIRQYRLNKGCRISMTLLMNH